MDIKKKNKKARGIRHKNEKHRRYTIQSGDGEVTNPNNSTEFGHSSLRATRGDYNLSLFVASVY